MKKSDVLTKTFEAESSDEVDQDGSNGVEYGDEGNDAKSSTLNGNDTMTACVACRNGHLPLVKGGHRCIKCSKAVHALPGCSNSCGEEQGYGEKRICVACAAVGVATSTQPS